MRSPVRRLIRFRLDSWERSSPAAMAHDTLWANEPTSAFEITNGVVDQPIRGALAQAEAMVRRHCLPLFPIKLWLHPGGPNAFDFWHEFYNLMPVATRNVEKLLQNLPQLEKSRLQERLDALRHRLGLSALEPSSGLLSIPVDGYSLEVVEVTLPDNHGVFGRFAQAARDTRKDEISMFDAISEPV